MFPLQSFAILLKQKLALVSFPATKHAAHLKNIKQKGYS